MIMPQVRHVEAVIVPIGDAGSNCLADLDIDGTVGILDLLTLLANWGPCPDPCLPCTGDLDGDGGTDSFDLAKLGAAWCSTLGGNPCGTCGP